MRGTQEDGKLYQVRSELPQTLYDRLAAEAKKNERSMAAEIRLALRRYLAEAAA